MNHIEAIKEYQCPGCAYGLDPAPTSCPSFKLALASGCKNHIPGTMELGKGTLFTGMPKGFDRVGPSGIASVKLRIAYDSEDFVAELKLKHPFSLAVWKHLDKHGNTLLRCYSPRTNVGWSVVILGDHRDKFPYAIEITAEQVEEMD